MEDALFECRFEQDDEYIKDNINYFQFRAPSRIALFVTYAVIILVYVFMAVRKTTEGTGRAGTMFWIIAAVLTAFLTFTIVFGYKRAFKISRKRKAELYGDSTPVLEVFVTEDKMCFLNTANEAKNTIAISSIVKVIEYKSLIIVKTGARQVVGLSKKGFTKGTPEGLVDFLHSKGVK